MSGKDVLKTISEKSVKFVDFRFCDTRVELFFKCPTCPLAPGQLFDQLKPGVVPRAGVTLAGIAQPDDQLTFISHQVSASSAVSAVGVGQPASAAGSRSCWFPARWRRSFRRRS